MNDGLPNIGVKILEKEGFSAVRLLSGRGSYCVAEKNGEKFVIRFVVRKKDSDPEGESKESRQSRILEQDLETLEKRRGKIAFADPSFADANLCFAYITRKNLAEEILFCLFSARDVGDMGEETKRKSGACYLLRNDELKRRVAWLQSRGSYAFYQSWLDGEDDVGGGDDDSDLHSVAAVGAHDGNSSVADLEDVEAGKVEWERVWVLQPKRDVQLASRIKEEHGCLCQICARPVVIPGGRYAEAHHIQPLSKVHKGPDVRANMMCVCPNCHVRLDKGAIRLDKRDIINGDAIGDEYIAYHNEHIYVEGGYNGG